MAKIYDFEALTEKFLVTDAPTVANRRFRIAGFAFKRNGEEHFTLRLKAFYKMPFFIVPNWKRPSEFLVFSGVKKRRFDVPKFFHVVGSANYIDGGKYLVIRMPDFAQTYFLKTDSESLHDSPALRLVA